MERRDLHTHVHSSIIHNSRSVEVTISVSTDEWINKMCYSYTHTHTVLFSLKKIEIVIHTTMWMKL